MKTADKIMTILAVLCVILSAICTVINFAAGTYWAAVLWMVIFGFDAWDAWRYLGMWIDYYKTIKQTQKEIDTLSD